MTDYFNVTCVPSGCSCAGHRLAGVRHIAPCCDKPHIDQLPMPAETDPEEFS